MSTSAPDECQQVLDALLLRWPEELSDNLSSALLDHLCHCRGCLRKWIALEAAADLASLSINSRDKMANDVDSDAAPTATELLPRRSASGIRHTEVG